MAVIHNIQDTKIKAETEALYGLDVHSIAPIPEGSENSNYLLATSEGEFVLTLFAEHYCEAQLEPRTHIMPFLALNGMAVPAIVPSQDGGYLTKIAGELAVLQPKLIGHHITEKEIEREHVRAMATHLAMQHCLPVPDDMKTLTHEYSLKKMNGFMKEIEDFNHPHKEAVKAAQVSLKKLSTKTFKSPLAISHADLFPDNTLFSNGTTLTGVIDWWMACPLPCLLDLAIVANAWCWDEEHKEPHITFMDSLEDTYRVLSMLPYELWKEEWPLMLEFAALIFVVMRLRNPVMGKAQEILDAKPVDPWLGRLLYWQEHNQDL